MRVEAEKTNIIQRQADDFLLYQTFKHKRYQSFIDEVRSELYEYNKDTHKIVFIERIIVKVKIGYDAHFNECTEKLGECGEMKSYENILYFLQEELEELEENLTIEDFTTIEKESINETLDKILKEINTLKLGQELIYTDISEEFDDLKTFYYLNKKNWIQLFQGKLVEKLADGVIDSVVSGKIIEIIKDNYDKMISS